jgi:hypothetical protein
VIEKNKEMKFLMKKEKEMKDKETLEEELGLSHSIYMENNIHYQPYLKEFYLSFQVMGLWIQKGHMDQFLSICDIHLIEHDDVMVRVFLQTLIGPTYEWYLSLPTQSIGSFDDIEDMFMTRYAQPIAYHTFLTQFTQIHLQKGERIKDFNLQFLRH